MTDKKQKSMSLDELMELEGNAPFDPFSIPNEQRGKETQKRPKRPSKDELKQARADNKHYLPVLSLNDPTMWPPAPKSARRHFTNELATETCLSNCCGVSGVFSGCCRLDPDDLEHILGPVKENWVKKFLRYARKKGWNYKRSDVVIDYEEGKLIGEKFFNGHPVFTKPTSYPMMRIQVLGPRFGCKFLNPENGMCGIYEQRPDMCRGYYCQYVKKNFLVKTKDKPNTWRRVDIGPKEEKE